jgi:hypothetical protein
VRSRQILGVLEQLASVVDERVKGHQAATLSFVVVSSSVTLVPSGNVAPSSSSLTRIRGAQVSPVLGGEVVVRQQLVAVLQAAMLAELPKLRSGPARS